MSRAPNTLKLTHALRLYWRGGRRFPALAEENIGNSRDASFEQLVLRRTRGRGVDLVLNSLADDKLQASVRCLAHGGRFLEIGKLDLSNNTNLVSHTSHRTSQLRASTIISYCNY